MAEPTLVPASLDRLPAYLEALERGWPPDNSRGAVAAVEQRAMIADDPGLFVSRQEDVQALGGPILLPDGSRVPRLPGVSRWIWDGAFCGVLGFRWQPGTAVLPPHVLGHVGFAVVPWKRGSGYAAAAVRSILPEARALGLPHVDLTTDPDNVAARRSIERAGGRLIERFAKPSAYGGGDALQYRIALP